MNISQKLALLRAAPPFDLLDADEQERLAERMSDRTVEAEQAVFKKDDPGDSLYLVAAGSALVLGPDDSGVEKIWNVLSHGDIFGEKALLSDSRRSATVLAEERLSLLRLEARDFRAILDKHPEIREVMARALDGIAVRDFVRQFTVIGAVPAKILRKLVASLEPVKAVAGEIIVRQGESTNRFYIVKSGKLKAFKREDGMDREVRLYIAGEFFGELAPRTGKPRAATVVAQEDCELFALSPEGLEAALAASPELRKRMDRVAAAYERRSPAPAAPSSRESAGAGLPRPSPPTSPSAREEAAVRPWRRIFQRSPFPFVRQRHHSDAGAACLAMVLRRFGAPASLTRTRDLANVSHEGATLESLKQAAEVLGLETSIEDMGKAWGKDGYADIRPPAITLWEGSRFIVVCEASKARVVAADPELGFRTLKGEEFRRGFKGKVLQLEKTERLKTEEEFPSAWALLGSIARPYLRWVVSALLLSLLLVGIGFAVADFTDFVVNMAVKPAAAAPARPASEPAGKPEAVGPVQEIVNSIYKPILESRLVASVESAVRPAVGWARRHDKPSDLGLWCAVMLVLTGAQAFMTGLRKWLLLGISTEADLGLLDRFLDHVMRLPMRYFDLRRVGHVVSALSKNADVREALVGTVPGVFVDTILAGIYILYLLRNDAGLALFALATILLSLAFNSCYTARLRAAQREHSAKKRDEDSYLIESVTGIGTIKMMGIEDPVRRRWKKLYGEALKAGLESSRMENIFSTGSTMLGTLSRVAFLGWGAHQLAGHRIADPGRLMQLVTIASLVTEPVLRLVDAWDELQEARGSVEHLGDVFEAEPEQPRSGGPAPAELPRLEGAVAFENVTFRYALGQERPALAGLSFEIKPGEAVALVGRSGSGKSTVAKLILGLYEPAEGRVLIDGHDVRLLARAPLRRRVGVVPQDVFLFSGTIRENIAPGVENPPFDKIERACRLAGVHDFIQDLPGRQGYDTKVGERGGGFSGGQRQKIALARALYDDPDVLLFDEATSALDADSERTIHRSVAEAFKGKTRILIAHRPSAALDAGRILVLDQGAIVEEGTHEELLRRGGVYAGLASRQPDG